MSSTSTVVHVPSLHSRTWYAPSGQIVLVIMTLSTSSGRSANTASALRNLEEEEIQLSEAENEKSDQNQWMCEGDDVKTKGK